MLLRHSRSAVPCSALVAAVGLSSCAPSGDDGTDTGNESESGGADPSGESSEIPEVGTDGEAAAGATGGGAVAGEAGSSAAGGSETGAAPDRHLIPDGRLVVNGRALEVEGVAIHLRGVCWNPVPVGGTHPTDLDFAGSSATDSALMAEAGINVVRTYDAITDRDVLDTLHEQGIKVIQSVYAWGGAEADSAVTAVNAVKDHPAVLMWLVGNEWNYNGLYVGLSFEESLARVEEVALLIKEADPDHLVATAYGELPSEETLAALSAIDVWGINSYRGLSFGDLFSSWAARSSKPMFLSEYGADAYDARPPAGENLVAQADATAALAGELEFEAARNGGVASGGTIFEWADEWWKDEAGSPSEHDVGGVAPGGGPHPDATFNEEWWGIVTIDRTKRPAYDELKRLFRTP